jgi:hypothetical protein
VELIFLPLKPRPTRNWPPGKSPAAEYASESLYRFWKGEKPRRIERRTDGNRKRPYRFTVKENAQGTFFPVAEPAGDALKGLHGLLGLHLEERTTFEEAIRIADLMNTKITSLTLTK